MNDITGPSQTALVCNCGADSKWLFVACMYGLSFPQATTISTLPLARGPVGKPQRAHGSFLLDPWRKTHYHWLAAKCLTVVSTEKSSQGCMLCISNSQVTWLLQLLSYALHPVTEYPDHSLSLIYIINVKQCSVKQWKWKRRVECNGWVLSSQSQTILPQYSITY